MTCSHNVVFLLDVADSTAKILLHLGVLRILNYLGCKFSLAKVRWDFKFFDSMGIQGRASRVGSFRELGSRSWEDFEEELEAKFSNRLCTPHLPGPPSRATVTRNILKETLLDYQWDRPEIASPAKPVLRSQKSKLTLTVDSSPVHSTHEGFVNAIFIFSPCPHSQRELWQFISGSYAHLSDELPPLHDLAEKFIPKGIREMIANQKVTLYWVDTTERSKLLESRDHIGYWRLVEQMCFLGGTILPSETLIRCLDHPRKGTVSSEPSFISWTQILPSNSSLNCLFSLPSALQRSFPQLDGILILKTDGREEARSCAVVLKPLTLSQRNFKGPVNISLKCTMTGWNAAHVSNLHTESWILCSESSGSSAQENSLFHQLVKCVLAQRLHMVAEVSLSSGTGFPCTGIFSPISGTAAVLSLLFAKQVAEAERSLLQRTVAEKFSKDEGFSLPKVESYVLSQAADDSGKAHQASAAEGLFGEWAQQELSHTHGWSSAVLEDWYSLSNLCGASSHMMEFFRMLQTSAAQEEEEAPKSEMLLTSWLAEFYQKKASVLSLSSHQRNHRRRLGVAPRTPVRQKMKTMPRSLQMLNVAMLNVKAQKCQPEGELPTIEKSSQRLPSRRLDNKGEEKGRTMKTKIDFRTEEEMLSYITTNYQKALIDREDLFACSQDMVTAVNVFQKSNEAACLDTIQSHLLKTSHTLRQQLASEPAKENGIKECQLQVYLRLEMYSQCPSLQNCTDRMEQLVEETTELLRVLCWTKDPGFLTRFLEEVAEMYMESLPKTLGDLYFSLGTQMPAKLASVLPADFFSDDFITEESQTPSLPPSAASVPLSKTASLSTEADELEELRTRSAQKRKNPLARHRSVTEASQNLRQIEIPQAPRSCRIKDTSQASLDVKLAPISEKTGMKEVTKVRRNLFNKEALPPGKGSLPKIPRSHSVSAVEELKHKHSRANEGIQAHHKLLTKRVAETPLHKQISRRLLQRQITGRCSDPGSDVGIVEESPEKQIAFGLRRSPRIKQLVKDKFLSKSFHSLEPKKSSIPQVHSLHLEVPKNQENQIGLPLPPAEAILSPQSIVFGKALDGFSAGRVDSPRRRSRQLASNEPVYQSPQSLLSRSSNPLRRSPRIQEKAQRTSPEAPALKNTVAKCLGNLFSPCRQKSKSLPECTKTEESSLIQIAQLKGRFSSSSKAVQLQTPDKQAQAEELDDVFVLLADGSSSPVTPSPHSELQSPRRSLRIAQKTTPAVLAERQTLEGRRNTCLEPTLSLQLDSVLSDASPTTFKDPHPELCWSPNVQTSAPETHSALAPEGISASCNLTVKAVAPCIHSPTREKLGQKSRIPQESPLKYQVVRQTSSSSPSCSPKEHLNLYGNKQEHPSVDSTNLFAESSPFCKPGHANSLSLGQKYKQTTDMIRPSERKDLERCVSPVFSFNSPKQIPHAVVVCEQLELSSLVNKSLSGSSQIDLDSKMSQSSTYSVEKATDLQPVLFLSPRRNDQPSLLGIPKSGSCAYALRCTPDRRQREAAARLEKLVASDTPGATLVPLTYEVELEMQASGLPKLRIKRVASKSGVEQQPLVASGKLMGEAPTLGDLSMAWCDKHMEKLEPVSISPSCVHSAHHTPRKFGVVGQTYICQSYSPVLCTSSTTSPSQGSIGIFCTPSPKHQGKVTPEAFKDWPRRKRATNGCNRSERPAEAVGEEPAQYARGKGATEFFNSRNLQFFEEPELEGVYKLQDQSPCCDTQASQDESICRETLGRESRKRVFEQTSPEQEANQEMKRLCPVREDPGIAVYSTELLSVGDQPVSSESGLEDLFCFSDLTPPKSSGKGAISASGLRALTQSPLLYQGHPAPLRKCPTGDDLDTLGAVNEDFLFHNTANRKRSITRTYSRKRLLH